MMKPALSPSGPGLCFLLMIILVGCGGPTSRIDTGKMYGVGVRTLDLVDPSRPTPANGTAPESSERLLTTEIWYPSIEPPGEVIAPARDAAAAEGPFPMVLFVHGSQSTRHQSAYLAAALAGAGYVVAAADFPLTTMLTPGGSSDWHVEDQVGDLAFLADELTAIAMHPSDALAGIIDPEARYSVVGHSTGGTVALLAAQARWHDDRVAAIASLSGNACFFDDAFFAARAVPTLVVDATRDLFVPWLLNGDRAYHLARRPKVHAVLLGGSHIRFTELDFDDEAMDPDPSTAGEEPLALTLAGYGDGSACLPVPEPADDPAMPIADQHDLTVRIVKAFLDKFVRRAGSDLEALRNGGADPRLVISQEF